MTWDELNKERQELENDLTAGRFDYDEWMALASHFAEFGRESGAAGIRRRAEFYRAEFGGETGQPETNLQ